MNVVYFFPFIFLASILFLLRSTIKIPFDSQDDSFIISMKQDDEPLEDIKPLSNEPLSELMPTAPNSTYVQDTTPPESNRAVIVTKVIGPSEKKNLSQMLCMLSHFFNDEKQYDVIVFTTLPWHIDDQLYLQKLVYPTSIKIHLEGPPLLEQVSALNTTQQSFLLNRCGNVTSLKNLTWSNRCTEEGSKVYKLGYGWQAEFRSYHIWNHPALLKYRYMMWLDSDAILSQMIITDPIQDAIHKNSIVSFAAFPYGRTHNQRLIHKMNLVYNHSICNAFLNKQTGRLSSKPCSIDSKINLAQIGGFHHITDLHVFRKPIHQQFLKEFVGDYKYSRKYDDQIAVTVVGLMEQFLSKESNERFLIHQRSTNVTLKIAHHCKFDNTERSPCKAKRIYNKLYKEDNTENAKLKDRCDKYFEIM